MSNPSHTGGEIEAGRIERLERELHQMKKLAAVGQMTCGVVHDFNNLLAIIEMNVATVLQVVPEDWPPRAELLEVRAVIQRAVALSRQLLAFSRGQVAADDLLEPNRVITELAPLLRRILGREIAMTISLESSLGKVRASASELEQVLVNVVVNARDAMPAGGRIRIETASIHLERNRWPGIAAGPYASIAVSDSGIGMDDETLARAFEPYFTTKPNKKGSGLGLSTVRKIVTDAGGAIEAMSRLGQGTTFNIYLPLSH